MSFVPISPAWHSHTPDDSVLDDTTATKDVVQTSEPATPQLREGEDPISKTLNSPLTIAAKPYIPSYLAALKRTIHPPPVMLEGVPVNVSKRPTDTWCSSTNISNSALEHDTVSSWADDDESFIQSMRTQQQSFSMVDWDGGEGTPTTRSTRGSHPRHHDPHAGADKRGARHQPGRGDKNNTRGWRTVEGNAHNSNSNSRRGGRSGGGGGGSSGGGGAARRHGEAAPSISGGRFDILANNNVMRHL